MGIMIARFCRLLLVVSGLAAAVASAGPRAQSAPLTLDGIPDAPPTAATDRLEDYLEAREATALGWSPQGQLLVRTRFGDVAQLHLIERADGARRQLTFGSEPVAGAAFSPDPVRNAFFFLKDQHGDGHDQLYYQRLGEPSTRLLTDGKSVNGAPVWSNSGQKIAFFSTARDGVSRDVEIVDLDSGALPQLALRGEGADWRPLDWAPDDHLLLVLKSVSSAESHLYLVDLVTGQKRELDVLPGKASIKDARFARDGQGVYYISDADGEFKQLRWINIFTGQKTTLSGQIPWDVDALTISRDGRYLAYISNEGGVDKLNLLDLVAHQDLLPPRLPSAGLLGDLDFDADGKRLAFSFAATNQPRDAYVLDMDTNRLTAWTRSEAGPVDPAKFVSPRLVKFPTFDRQGLRPRELLAYVYEPAAAGPHPVLIWLESGPDRQFRPGFDPWIQYVVGELGFAVVAPNLRGTPGYGKSYLALDQGLLREDAIKDLGALLVWLRGQSRFDAKHVIVSGSDYGGYLALAALVNFGDRVLGGVAFAGISDFVEFLSLSPPDLQLQRRADYGDERDPDTRAYLRRISPFTNADRIGKPVLLAHGSHDRQVPIDESEQLVNRLRSHGTAVWYLVATDQGHGFHSKRAHDAFLQTFAQFLVSLH
jgi:dipeptidyl aminopeptidase/acylaminoacyl peptidase